VDFLGRISSSKDRSFSYCLWKIATGRSLVNALCVNANFSVLLKIKWHSLILYAPKRITLLSRNNAITLTQGVKHSALFYFNSINRVCNDLAFLAYNCKFPLGMEVVALEGLNNCIPPKDT